MHMGYNMSRHSPILLKLRVGDIPLKKKMNSSVPKKPAWHKATQKILVDYKADLHSKLVDMTLPVSMCCENPHCRDPAHSTERDSHMFDMLCSVIESSHSVIPLAGGQRAGSGTGRSDFTSGCLPGWKEEVEPF